MYFAPWWLLVVCLPIAAVAAYLALRGFGLSRPGLYALTVALSPVLLLGAAVVAITLSTYASTIFGPEPQPPTRPVRTQLTTPTTTPEPAPEPAAPATTPGRTVPEATRPAASPSASPASSPSASPASSSASPAPGG